MRIPLKKTIRILLALLILLIGCVGLVLPILNGVLFLLVGLLILSLESPALEARLDKYGRKYPKLEFWYDKCKVFVQKYF